MYVDTAIFMYAVGRESMYREPCRRIVRAGAAGRPALVTSTETLQEVLHRFTGLGRDKDVRPTFDMIVNCVQRVLPVTFEDMEEACRLGEKLKVGHRVSARDLVHAAVARRQGLREILTTDTDFTLIPGVTVIDPLRLAETL